MNLPWQQNISEVPDRNIIEYPWWQQFHNDTALEIQYRQFLAASNCETLACLRRVPEGQMLKTQQDVYNAGYAKKLYGQGDFWYGPSVDGVVIRDLPSNEFKRGNFAKVRHPQLEVD